MRMIEERSEVNIRIRGTSRTFSRSAFRFAKEYTTLSQDDEQIIMHTRRAVLVGERETIWTKKDQEDFDVAMGSMDGAELSELVGLYLLYEMEKFLPKGSVGLYRDDGLCIRWRG